MKLANNNTIVKGIFIAFGAMLFLMPFQTLQAESIDARSHDQHQMMNMECTDCIPTEKTNECIKHCLDDIANSSSIAIIVTKQNSENDSVLKTIPFSLGEERGFVRSTIPPPLLIYNPILDTILTIQKQE